MCSYFDTTDSYLRFISTAGQTTVPFFRVVIFSGGSKNIAGQTTVPFFPVVIFLGPYDTTAQLYCALSKYVPETISHQIKKTNTTPQLYGTLST